jgi:hypothetical protein
MRPRLMLAIALSLLALPIFAQATKAAPLYPLLYGDVYCYVDASGALRIKPQFAFAGSFSQGLAAVNVGGLWDSGGFLGDTGEWKYIDTQGIVVIGSLHAYDEVSEFSENGLACVHLVGGDYGYIDRKGKLVIPARYSSALPFSSNGLAGVRIGEKYGYIDSSGRTVIQPVYDEVTAFASNGLARVKVGERYGFVDAQGRLLIPAKFEGATRFGEHGLAGVNSGGKRGFIDSSGQYRIAPRFDGAGFFSAEGLAMVKVGKLWGFVDTSGKLVIAPAYEACSSFSWGRAAVQIRGLWGYIDASGRLVVEPSYDAAGDFDQAGRALVWSGPDQLLIDREGRTIVAGR